MIKSTAGHWLGRASKEMQEKQDIQVWEFWPWFLLQFGLIALHETLFSLGVNVSCIVYLNVTSIDFKEVSLVQL